jgi:hypothetical protein
MATIVEIAPPKTLPKYIQVQESTFDRKLQTFPAFVQN